jgi:NAD(P)-dependent dehydrogenase (short-subunit alcohol dehydrogenase family)
MSFANYPSLSGRTVLVTGGGSGIGADIVRAFCGQKAKVAFLDIQKEPGDALAAETGAHFEEVDLTDIPALRAAVTRIIDRLGPVHVLVNNAANDQRQEVDVIEPDDWDTSQNINLRALFFMAQAVREGMAAAGGGSIINVSSIVWRLAGGDMVPYATAKAGVVGLTKSLAHALAPDNIRVNAIEPGAIFTERQRELWYPTEADVNALVSQQLLKRAMDGGEIARMALFLASDDARMITKQSFIVDAGLL